jgi:hypothetical protein
MEFEAGFFESSVVFGQGVCHEYLFPEGDFHVLGRRTEVSEHEDSIIDAFSF